MDDMLAELWTKSNLRVIECMFQAFDCHSANAKVATILGSILASSDTAECDEAVLNK